MVLPEGTMEKSQVTPLGIDPRTVRLAAQRLSHYATQGPTKKSFHINRCRRTLGFRGVAQQPVDLSALDFYLWGPLKP